MESNTIQDIENMTEYDIHLPDMALPIQTKQNKAILGRISTSNYPIGARGGDGVTEYEIVVNNSNSLVMSNSDICLNLKIDQDGTTPRTGANLFAGGQTLFKSVNASLGSHKLCDIQNAADRVGDFHVKSTHTNDELDYLSSLTGYKVSGGNEDTTTKTLSIRVPLKWYGLDFGNLLPTGNISSSLRINLSVNDKVLNQFSDLTAGANKITISDLRLETEFIELQSTVRSKRLALIKGTTGLTIPYHAYSVDTRTIPTTNKLSERIAMTYNNVVSMFQLPYNNNDTKGYYEDVRWNDDVGAMNNVNDYLVNLPGGTYFNLNSNSGQSGKASHSKALMESLRTENTTPGAGSAIVKGIDDYQVLCANFVRANNVLSPAIIDSGINAKFLSGLMSTNAQFKTDISAGKSLTTIVKYTQRIVMKSTGMAVYS